MSSASSTVTYTSVDTVSEPGRAFWPADEELSDGGSPRVIVYGYDGLPIQPVAPPSPDYIPGPEDPQAPQVPQDEDEREPMFVQAHDPDYVPEPIYPEYIPLEDEHVYPAEEQPLPPVDSPTALSLGYVADSDPEEDPEEDSEEEHVDYPADGGDDDDNDDDDDDDDDDTGDEEEGHLAPVDPSDVHVPLAEDAEALEADEPVPTPPSPQHIEVERLLALPTPLPSPLISLSPPPAEERLARCLAAPALPSPPLPPLPDSLFIPSVDRREEIPEAELPPHKRLCLTAPASRYEVGESSTAVPRPTGGRRVDYGFVGTLDAEARRQRAEAIDYGIRDTWEQDTQEIYALIEDTQDRQTQIYQTVETLVDDSRSAVHFELQGYKTNVWTQDHRMDVQDSLIAALTAQVSSLQGHLATALGEIQALQAREQARTDAPEGTGSSS
ncbi:hypothetical protein Tco_0763303 [Tanacetum coccineum]